MRTLNLKYTSLQELQEFILKNNISQEKNVLLQIFTGVCELNFIQMLLSDIKSILPDVKIIGSTTSGEIIDATATTNATIFSFSLFEETQVVTYGCNAQEESYETAKSLISQFDTKTKAKVAISFADGLNINGEEYINAFGDYDKELIVAGGLAGDNSEFIQTIVFTQEEIFTSGAVVALLLNENLKVVTNASFGWESIGKIMSITKAHKNVVYEIDGVSAVDIYEKYLGEDIAKELPNVGVEFPLIIKRKNLNIPRAILGKNSDGSLVFAGNLSTGDKVTFGYGNIQAILHYGDILYENDDIKKSESIFVYSCMARLRLLNENVNSELAPLDEICSVSGFFTYGEFYSNQDIAKHELLNQTMTILSLSEGKKVEALSIKNRSEFTNKNKQNLTLKALSHLIAQTSSELEKINYLLEDRVRLEIKENRKKEKAMLQQSRLAQMGEMISMIAHQWRQPLSAISATSTSLRLKATLGKLDKEQTISLTEKITSYTQHLSETIDDFREFFKPNKEKVQTTYSSIIHDVLSLIQYSMQNKAIELNQELNCEDNFFTYPNEIKQVILNLIKNAEDVLLEKKIQNPYIKLKTFKDGDKLILEVSDNAGGVPAEIVDKMFEPYFSTKTKKDGTGLGLYMSKIIIEEHCMGRLSVSNDNNGAVFRIELQEINIKV